MNEARFLTYEEVLRLHQRSIERHGGTLGIRDPSGLDAAVNHPKNVLYYAGGDLFDMAAAYAFNIAQRQYLLDGNKRTAVTTALTFLRLNGIPLVFDELELYDLLIGIAEKRFTKQDLATRLRYSVDKDTLP